MDVQTELLREAVELLRLIAEPYIAKRDERLRSSLYDIVGKSSQRANAVRLMDGSKTQAEIRKETGIDQAALSRLTKALREAALVFEGDKPKLNIPLPTQFPVRAE
jgi:uncharacterized protein YerC